MIHRFEAKKAEVDSMSANIKGHESVAAGGSATSMSSLCAPHQAAFWYRLALKDAPVKDHFEIKSALMQLWEKSRSDIPLIYEILMAFEEYDSLAALLMSLPNKVATPAHSEFYKLIMQDNHFPDVNIKVFFLMILDNFNVNYFNLRKALEKGRSTETRFLQETWERIHDHVFSSLLQHAFHFNWPKITTFLCNEMKVDPCLGGKMKPTVALSKAVMTGNVILAKSIISRYNLENLEEPQPFNMPLVDGKVIKTDTYVFMAAVYLNYEMLVFLIEEKKARVDGMYDGCNLFEFIIWQACKTYLVPEKLAEVLKIIQYLSSHFSAQLPLPDRLTPLHYAAACNNVELAKGLVEVLNAHVAAENIEGITPLHIATDKGSNLKSYLITKAPELKQEPDHLTLKGIRYRSTCLCAGKNVFLLETKEGERLVAKQITKNRFDMSRDTTGVTDVYYCKELLGLGERVFTITHPDSCFLLMPYIPGKPLGMFVPSSAGSESSDDAYYDIRYESLTINEFFSAFLSTTENVKTLHTRYHAIHGDLNATNIIWNKTKATIIDFGHIVKEGEAGRAHPLEYFIIESGQKTDSQEQKAKQMPQFTDDIYALGITFSELYKKITTDHLSQMEIAKLNELYSRFLQPLLNRMLHVNPDERPRLDEIQDTLKTILSVLDKRLASTTEADVSKVTVPCISSFFAVVPETRPRAAPAAVPFVQTCYPTLKLHS